jgi:tRNA pseudouridine38-40 synthase
VPGETAGRRYALLVEYDGTDLVGSQVQAAGRTVQGELEEAARRLSGRTVRVAFAGRTDAGVHAVGQVAALTLPGAHPPKTVRNALNHYLARDVAVRAACHAEERFDPRREAVARVYRYRLADGRGRSPLQRRWAWERRAALDERAMTEAAARWPREQVDWAAYASPVSDGYPTARTLRRCEVERRGANRLDVTVEADGFLPHQVRRMVGALERVGAGREGPAWPAEGLSGEPGSAGPTAPAHGLALRLVRYPPGTVSWDIERTESALSETGRSERAR